MPAAAGERVQFRRYEYIQDAVDTDKSPAASGSGVGVLRDADAEICARESIVVGRAPWLLGCGRGQWGAGVAS